jgi:hypothetical protein
LGEGSGPADPQRVIFGYVGRQDYVDSAGNAWRPATEFIFRMQPGADLVPIAFWTDPRIKDVAGTPDPELYRYGIRGGDFTAYFTVAPTQTYHVRLKFCQTEQSQRPGGYATNIDILDKPVVSNMDIAATAGGLGKAVDLVFNGIQPKNGIISMRFWHRFFGNATIQAIEVGPGSAPDGAKPVTFPFPPGMNYLANPGFEEGIPGVMGSAQRNPVVQNMPWNYRFLGPNQGIVWGESAFVKHPQAGRPKPRSGKEALRTHAQEKDCHTQVYQDVSVDSGRPYRATVWVQGVDLHGKGFGTHPDDSAGLCVLELDAAGKVLVQHPKVAVSKPADFTELIKTFTTNEKTVKVRFLLDTVIGCRWDEGHVTYDDCALIRQEER